MAGITIYAPDLPGHGHSNGTGRAKIADYADWLLAFLDALSVEQATLAGHSMGGAIALDLALRHPDRVAGLILIATGARLRVLPAILEGLLQDFEATLDLIVRSAFGPEAPESVVRLSRQRMAATSPAVLHDDFRACDAFDVRDRLGQIQVPTLVICGTADQLTPAKYAAYLQEHIPGASLVLIEGAGHMVMLEKPDVVAEAVAHFLGLRPRVSA